MIYLWRQYIGDLMYNSSLEYSNDSMISGWDYGDGLDDEWEWNLADDDILDEVKDMYDAAEETYVRGYSFSYKNDVNDYMIVLINYHLWNTALVNITIENNEDRKYFYGYNEY